MKNIEFEKKQEELLKDTNPKLASVLRSVAYDRGHAYGYEEVLGILEEQVEQFKEINELLKDK